MIYLATRHPGTLAWLQARFADETVTHITHLDDSLLLHPGDCIVGNLPVQQVAKLNARGVRYLHLCIPLPAHLRGHELTCEQLNELGTSLQEYRVLALSPLDHLIGD